MAPYIDLAIGRQLSSDDRRMLVNREKYVVLCQMEYDNHVPEVGDGGYAARLIEQAVDLELMKTQHKLLWARLEPDA